MFWIIARAMNLALTAAAIAAGIVVSGGFSKTAWAKLATNDLDLGSLSALAETNSLAEGAKVILASVQPLIDRVMAYLADVKANEGQYVAGFLNRQLEMMQDSVYSGNFVALAMPIGMLFAAVFVLRFVFRILLRKPRKGRTSRSDFQVV